MILLSLFPFKQRMDKNIKKSDYIIYSQCYVFFQSPIVKGVEIVNGGYGIKNPLLTETKIESRHEPLGN